MKVTEANILHGNVSAACGDTAHTGQAHPSIECLAELAMPKKIDGACPYATPKCVNCDADHPANSPSCPGRIEALAEQRSCANKQDRGPPPS